MDLCGYSSKKYMYDKWQALGKDVGRHEIINFDPA